LKNQYAHGFILILIGQLNTIYIIYLKPKINFLKSHLEFTLSLLYYDKTNNNKRSSFMAIRQLRLMRRRFNHRTYRIVTNVRQAIEHHLSGNTKVISSPNRQARIGTSQLFIDLTGYADSEVSIKRIGLRVLVDIKPLFPDALLQNKAILKNLGLNNAEAKQVWGAFSEIRYSRCSIHDVTALIGQLLEIRFRGRESFWWRRALSIVRVALTALIELRDGHGMTITVNTLRDHITLESLVKLVQDARLSENARKGIFDYLNDIPAFDMEQALVGNFSFSCREQHLYLTQLTSDVLAILSQWSSSDTREAMSRNSAIPDQKYIYKLAPHFQKIEAKRVGNQLLIEVTHQPDRETISFT
jgi:hypothetical protein